MNSSELRRSGHLQRITRESLIFLDKRLLDPNDLARGAGYRQAYVSLGNWWKPVKFRRELRKVAILSPVRQRESPGRRTSGIIRVSRRGDHSEDDDLPQSGKGDERRGRAARCCFSNKRFVTVNSYKYALYHRLWDITLGLSDWTGAEGIFIVAPRGIWSRPTFRLRQHVRDLRHLDCVN